MYVSPYFEATKPRKVANWKYYFRVWAACNILSSSDFSLRYAAPPTICGISNFTDTRQFSHHSFTLYVSALVMFVYSNILELKEKK